MLKLPRYDSLADTDGDGFSDFFEIRTGWMGGLPVPGYRRKAYPDPRFTDSDGDGWSDTIEFNRLTDSARGRHRSRRHHRFPG